MYIRSHVRRLQVVVVYTVSVCVYTHTTTYVSTYMFGIPSPPPLPPRQPVDEELWYYGEVSRRDAEQLLRKDGDYLIRLSRDKGYVLTMKWQGGPKHFVVQTTDDDPVGERGGKWECVRERVRSVSCVEKVQRWCGI